jgi:putative tricarboxylic transport membrane protein
VENGNAILRSHRIVAGDTMILFSHSGINAVILDIAVEARERGLTLIGVISRQDTLNGLIAGFFGLLIGSIGPDHIYAAPRATFGFLELYDGVPLVPALIGLFALSEAFIMIEQKMIVSGIAGAEAKSQGWAQVIQGLRMSLKRWWHIVWTSLIGLFVGVLPGAGANIAGFVAYQQSRLFSKTPELYGTGHPEGLLAPESANNGVTAGTLVPLLTLGIPGGATAAVMLIVLQYHGVPLGPKLFMDSPELAYGVIMTMLVCYFFMALTIIPLARYLSWVVRIPTQLLAPLIIAFTLVGAFAPREYLFDMGLALVFGVIGYLARKTGYQTAAILIGIVLGPLVEQNYLRALRLAQGDPLVLFSSRLGNVLWVFLFLSVAYPFVMDYLKRRESQKG